MSEAKKIFVVGAGGHARVVLDAILMQPHTFQVTAITDSNVNLHGKTLYGLPIAGDESVWENLKRSGVIHSVVAIGDNKARARMADKLRYGGFELVNVIHPSAVVSPHAHLEKGIVVMAGAIIQSGAEVHDNVIINTGASIDHDCVIERHVHIAPGSHLGGNVQISEGTLVGIGSSVVPHTTIGKWCVIGAGSVVKDEIGSWQMAAGVPARIIKPLSQ
ncbi:MAG: acetyltransferase [bacterium]